VKTPLNAHRLLLTAAIGSAMALAGCRGDREDAPPRQFFPDLDDAPKWKPQSGSEFFVDGRTMRKPVAGTVPFGRLYLVSDEPWAAPFMQQRTNLLREDKGFYEGQNPDGTYLTKIPVPVTVEMLRRGQERFNIYCSACHGFTGDGKGMVGVQFNPAVPNYHDAKYKDPNEPDGKSKDGYLFHTIRYGVINVQGVYTMPSYAHAVDEQDAWAIVAYIRALQASREGTLGDVPEAQRPAVERLMGALTEPPATPTPAPAAPPPPTTPQTGGATK